MLQVWHQVFSKSKNLVFTLFGTKFSKSKKLVLWNCEVWHQVFPNPKKLGTQVPSFSKPETWCLGNTKFDTKFFKIQKLGSSSYVQPSGTKFFKIQKLGAQVQSFSKPKNLVRVAQFPSFDFRRKVFISQKLYS